MTLVQEVTRDTDFSIVTYHDAFKKIMCSNPTSECYLDKCESCPSTDALKDFLQSVLVDHYIDRIKYQYWQQTDRSTLRTEISDAEYFTEELRERLVKLKFHSIIAKKQSSFLKYLKNSLKEEFLILCNFAENYTFIAQNPAQSFH